MSRYRFFISSSNIVGDVVTAADQDTVHHIKNVLRLKTGAIVTAVDETGAEYDVRIGTFGKAGMLLRVIARGEFVPSVKTHVAIACAVPKKSSMDDIIDKLTQLGVDRIIPLRTERVIVRWNAAQRKAHHARWEKIAVSSGRQSGRRLLPRIEHIQSLEEALETCRGCEVKVIPTLPEHCARLKDVIDQKTPKSILVCIGPEGDFSPREVDAAVRAGCIPVTLGDLVLRVETAAVAVAGFLMLSRD